VFRLIRRRSRSSGAVLAVLASLALASTATAGTNHVGCGVINPGVVCQGAYDHHFYLSTAYYNGAGTVALCARSAYSPGGGLYAQGCADNNVSVNYPVGPLLWTQVYNASRYAHTIEGDGYF
jgi:hypothetical protein